MPGGKWRSERARWHISTIPRQTGASGCHTASPGGSTTAGGAAGLGAGLAAGIESCTTPTGPIQRTALPVALAAAQLPVQCDRTGR